MNFCSLQDAYGIKTFKSPKVVKLGQKGKGLRGLYDTPGAPPKSDTIGAPAGGCEDQEDVLITKARQTTPIVVEDGPAPVQTENIRIVKQQPLFDINLDRMDLGIVVFSLGVMLMVVLSKR